MKTLSIQVEPERNAQFNEEEIPKFLRTLGFEPEVKQGIDDNGRYINYYIDTDDLAAIWKNVSAKSARATTVGMICCFFTITTRKNN